MAKVKVRDFTLASKSNKPSARLAADAQIADLNRRLGVLGEILDRQQNLISMYIEQLAEVNLRVRFCMEFFQYEKGATIIGLNGKPVRAEIKSMYQLYLSDRDRFLLALQGVTDGPITSPHDGPEAGGARTQADGSADHAVPGAGTTGRDFPREAEPRPA